VGRSRGPGRIEASEERLRWTAAGGVPLGTLGVLHGCAPGSRNAVARGWIALRGKRSLCVAVGNANLLCLPPPQTVADVLGIESEDLAHFGTRHDTAAPMSSSINHSSASRNSLRSRSPSTIIVQGACRRRRSRQRCPRSPRPQARGRLHGAAGGGAPRPATESGPAPATPASAPRRPTRFVICRG